MGHTIPCLSALLFQLIPNKFWFSLLLGHSVSCSCFFQVYRRTFYGSGIFTLLAARKYQAVGYGKPYLRIALHLMAHCSCTERLHVHYVLELMETGVDVIILPSGDTLTFVS